MPCARLKEKQYEQPSKANPPTVMANMTWYTQKLSLRGETDVSTRQSSVL